MKFRRDTEALKMLANLRIETQHTEDLGVRIFNNLGEVSEEYEIIKNALHTSCDKIQNEIERLKSIIPN